MLHCVLRQHRDLSDLRCADQENSTSLCVSARLIQVRERPTPDRITVALCVLWVKREILSLSLRLSVSRNRVLVAAIVFQLCLGNLLCYCPGMPNIFNFMPIR